MNDSPRPDASDDLEPSVQPYAPPRAVTDRMDRVQRLGQILQFALSAFLVIEMVTIASSWLQLVLLSTDFTDAAAEANDHRERLVAIVYLACLIPLAILFMRWIYVAKKDLRELGVRSTKFTPGWSVGWFFVPIANLWKPYQAMAETFRASDPQRMAHSDWRNAPVGIVVKLWWFLWIFGVLVAYVSSGMLGRAETVEEFEAATNAQIVSSIVVAASTVTAIGLVRAICARRGERRAAIERMDAEREEGSSGPPRGMPPPLIIG